jgi:hypothetical protein
MIAPPPSWSRHGGVHVLTLVPPRGKARIRYHERLPPRPFVDTVDALLAEDRALRVHLRSEVSRLVTVEGEYAAWLSLGGEDAGGPVRRWIGAVLLDEFVAALDGVSHEPALDDTVATTTRWLLAHASYRLRERPRRYLYRAPEGWQGVPSGLVTTWYPPGFPRRATALAVHPAEASADDPSALLDALLADEEARGFERSGNLDSVVAPGAAGLSGRCWRYAGRWPSEPAPLLRSVVILSDGARRYVLRLERAASGGDDDAVLLATAATVRPLPRAGGATPASIHGAPGITSPWSE